MNSILTPHSQKIWSDLLTSPPSYNLRSGRKIKTKSINSTTKTKSILSLNCTISSSTQSSSFHNSPIARKQKRIEGKPEEFEEEIEDLMMFKMEGEVSENFDNFKEQINPNENYIPPAPLNLKTNGVFSRKVLRETDIEQFIDPENKNPFLVNEDKLLPYYIEFKTFELPEYVYKKIQLEEEREIVKKKEYDNWVIGRQPTKKIKKNILNSLKKVKK